MLYMVIERFKEGAAPKIYARFRERGRMMPSGLEYISSWIDSNYTICFQVMRSDDHALFDAWIEQWKDLMDFEIIPVRASAEAVAAMAQPAG